MNGDPDLLESALSNLLDNAASFAGPGGRVHVDLSAAEKDVTIHVHDTGPGIPEEHRARVFDRFFTTRSTSGGTGLGLSFVRAIAEAHGGTVRALTPPEGGALMALTLSRSGVRSGFVASCQPPSDTSAANHA